MRLWSPKSPGHLLPGSGTTTKGSLIPRRYTRLCGLTTILTVLLIFMFYFDKVPFVGGGRGGKNKLPPLYEKYNQFEHYLPQHNERLRAPEGKSARFIHFANHQTSAGWGNALQELFLNAHLAIALGRSYVFDNYTWDREPQIYSQWGPNGNMIPSRIPLSTMITGPLVGGSLAHTDSPYTSDTNPYASVPRPVSSSYFKKICPNPVRVDTKPINDKIGWPSGAKKIVDVYLEELGKGSKFEAERCLEIPEGAPQIFHVFLFGSPYVQDIWPSLKSSPVLINFGWSPLIINAFETNRHLWEAHSSSPQTLPKVTTKPIIPPTPDTLPSVNTTTRSPIPGLLALHIRRGDFEGHCNHLATWSAHFNGWNDFPSFPDQFTPPPGAGWGENTPANRIIYRKHCYPSVDEIVDKVLRVRKEHEERTGRRLGRIYAMTNAKKSWLDVLEKGLRDALAVGRSEGAGVGMSSSLRGTAGASWEDAANGSEDSWPPNFFTSSREMRLSWEQKFVSQAVDMYVGGRAEVFIGNGFSSLTSNVAMLRQAFERDPNTTRFW